MKSRENGCHEETNRTLNPEKTGKTRFLTDAQIQELLGDMPVQVISFCHESRRAHCRIA